MTDVTKPRYTFDVTKLHPSATSRFISRVGEIDVWCVENWTGVAGSFSPRMVVLVHRSGQWFVWSDSDGLPWEGERAFEAWPVLRDAPADVQTTMRALLALEGLL